MTAGKQPTARPHRADIPIQPQVYSHNFELRVDRPYVRQFDCITYVGVVVRQTWTVNPHYHEHYELCYVDEGRGWFQQNGRLYETRPGDLFLSRPGECHHGAATSSMPFRLYYMGFKLNRMPELAQAFDAIGARRVVGDGSGDLRLLFDRILDETREQRLHAMPMVQGLFMQLLVATLRSYTAQAGQVPPPLLLPAIQRALDTIHADVGTQHTLDSLASAAGVSRAHLTRMFRRALGVSVQGYIRRLCLDRACYFLRETDEPIAWIAEQLHFSTIHAFSVFFKRHMHVAPLTYRQRGEG